MGLQVVRVGTKRGWVVLASDAAHFYANMEQERPFPIIYNRADVVEGYKTLSSAGELAEPHRPRATTPWCSQRYPAANDRLAGIAARLDVEPGRGGGEGVGEEGGAERVGRGRGVR